MVSYKNATKQHVVDNLLLQSRLDIDFCDKGDDKNINTDLKDSHKV